jgi:hypothetical protein
MAGGFRPGFIFQRINRGPAGCARSTMDRWRCGQRGAGARRRAHRSSASSRSGAPKHAGRGAKGREEHGELGSGLTGARAALWRPGDGRGTTRSRETRWGGFLAREWRGEGCGAAWSTPGVVGVAFIGPGEGAERGGRSNGVVNSH